uniref:Uncharacterized protein n=1 Tax=Peronospora matthiolae TaxID=2874970 RepID=A0AAV1THI6_9STRA
MQHEMALSDHWRQQVDLRHSRMSFLVVELSHSNFAGESLRGSPGVTQGPSQDSTTDDRLSALSAGKWPLRKSSCTSTHPAKRTKRIVPDVLMAKRKVLTRSEQAASPSVPTSSDLSLNYDSKPIRAAMSGSRSSRRRP